MEFIVPAAAWAPIETSALGIMSMRPRMISAPMAWCVLELAGCFVDAGDLFAWIAFVEWKTHEPVTHTVAQFSLFVLDPHTHRSLNPEVEFVGSHATMREVFAKCSRRNGEHDIVHRAVE
jgi:hypothetical protein